jgi:predicted ATPase
MIALNEPETSLHPDVIDPLAKLIVAASKESQMWIVTHSEPLAQLVEEHSRFKPIRLQMIEGQTRFAGSNSCWQSLEKDVVNEA